MKFIYLAVLALFIAACGSSPEIAEEPVTNTRDQSKAVSETVASHTVENDGRGEPPVTPVPLENGQKRKWSRSGTPIDTSKLDAAVSAAEKTQQAASGDAAAKKALAKAYFDRGVALTDARQYASAIGDFRRTLKYDAGNEDAKKQLAMITSIYDSMNIESPAEGEEPAPLEFKPEKK